MGGIGDGKAPACKRAKLGKVFAGLAQGQFVDRTRGGGADDSGNRAVNGVNGG